MAGDNGWVTSVTGTAMGTADEGWDADQSHVYGYWLGLHIFDLEYGWAQVAQGMTRHTLTTVHAVDANTVYAAGSGGVFLKYGPLPVPQAVPDSLTPVYLLLLE